MKKLILIVVALFLLGMYSASAQKMAHISYEKVMDTLATYKKAEAMQLEIEEKAQETAQYIQKQIQTKAADYERRSKTMSEIERTLLEDEITNLQQRMQEVQANYQSQMEIIQTRYYVKIEEWLKKAVDIVGKEKGFDYIFYYSEQGGFFWVNPSKGVDLTNAVISQMLILEKTNPIKEPGQ